MGSVRLPDGHRVARLGQGTWRMGEDRERRGAEIDSLRLGIELGMTLIDTAEMYGNGESERVVGEAIRDLRDRVTIVSKVLPGNASRAGIAASCRNSLRRLGVDRLDVYLLHWRGGESLPEVVDAFETLRQEELIRSWGVSNFDVDDMAEFAGLARFGSCVVNQVLYNLEHRGIEHDLLPYAREHGVTPMAYSPVGQGGALLRAPALAAVAKRHGATPAQVAIAWTLRHGDVVSIPKSGDPAHVRENAAAAALQLDEADLRTLDVAFPPPRGKQTLAML
ncbi:MAG: aldo/keto reductase [Gluconacetobacter diazotrophicus]|nr:aldo/keto reductase [Gluconacetobacter diazotrophicus]